MDFLKRLLAVVALAGAGNLAALEKDIDLSLIHHHSWSGTLDVANGVRSISQTTDGRFYLGAEGGVNVFDGLDHYLVSSPEREMFSSTRVTSTCVDGLDAMWVGYESGHVDRMRGKEVAHHPPQQGRVAGSVHAMACTADSAWVASDSGLAQVSKAGWRVMDAASGLPPARILGVFAAAGGATWAATADALYVARTSTAPFLRVGALDSLPGDRIPITATLDGTVWIGTSHRLLRIRHADGDTPQLEPFREGQVTALLADSDGVLWVGANGLERFVTFEPGEVAQRKTRADGLSGNDVRHLFEDRDGNVWAATSGGLDRFKRAPLVRVPLPVELQGAKSLLADGATLWVGVAEQGRVLQLVDGRLVANLPAPAPEIGHRDVRGNIWFAGSQGVSRFANGRFVTVPLPEAARRGKIAAFASDVQGTLWLAVDPVGIFRFAGGKWLPGSGIEGLPAELPTALELEGTQALWLGYNSGQVFRLGQGRLRGFDSADGLSGGGVVSLYAASPRIWVGTYRSMMLFDGSKWIVRPWSGCGPLRAISSIQETPEGAVWLYRPFSVIYAVRGVEKTLANETIGCRSLSSEEGIVGEMHTRRGARSLAHTSDGRVWLSTEQALSWWKPERMAGTLKPPKVSVERVESASSDDIETAPGMQFPPGTQSLRMTYTGWSLGAPAHVRFRHRLVSPGDPPRGADEWEWVGNDRAAFFSNLTPGAYRFELQGSILSRSEWGEIAVLPFVILAYFYETTWFLALVIAALAGLLTALFRWQLRRYGASLRERLDERTRERERISRELHDTLLQGVQGLVLQFQAAAAHIPRNERAAGAMDDLLDRADLVIAESRDRISQLREVPPSTTELPDALDEAARALAHGQQIAISVKTQGQVRQLDGSVNSEVFLVAREALSNAIRHSGGRHVEVTLHYERFWFRVRVRDDGRGLPQEVLRDGARSGHFGLDSMRERAGRLRGSLRVAPAPDGGTEVELRIPAALAYPKEP